MKIMNRIKITKNRVVACFAAILLLLPATVGAQHFDAHIAGRKVTLQECFDLAARQNLQMQAGKKSVERAQVMQGTAWELDKTEVAFSQKPCYGWRIGQRLYLYPEPRFSYRLRLTSQPAEG